MTAATVTLEAASAELLVELAQLLRRYDDEGGYLDDLDECGELADKLSAALRRFRGRITRLRKTAERAKPEKQATPAAAKPLPAEQPAPQRAEVRIPPGEPPADRQSPPEPQQERPPEPPPEAPETPPLPPPGPRSWAAWLNAWLLAAVSTVIALILGVCRLCSLVARVVRSAARRVVHFFAARRTNTPDDPTTSTTSTGGSR